MKYKKVNFISIIINDKVNAKFKYKGLIKDEDFLFKITREYYIKTLCKDLLDKSFKEINKVFEKKRKSKKWRYKWNYFSW